MNSNDWSVIVFKSEKVRDILIDFYRFMEDLTGVKNLHFLIRGRVANEVIFSFRILLESKEKDNLEEKITFKLNSLMNEDKFVINPNPNHPLYKYVAWSWKDRINKMGSEKITIFCSYFNQLSKIVVDMAEKNYFNSKERVEIARIMSWIVGCTEYGLLSSKGMQIGYYDRINDKHYPYLKSNF